MSRRVGVLHTVPALAPVFHDLIIRSRPDLDVVHLAEPALLARVVESGVTDDVRAALASRLGMLKDAGASAVLVTCSSIGEAAVDAAAVVGVRLVRVDAPMAERAADRARNGNGRILVLATLTATLGPTVRLVERAAGSGIQVEARLVEGAAAARSSGDPTSHDRLIGEAVAAAGDVDAIVLAQASMAGGAGDDPRVLTSPESGAEAFVAGLA